MTATATGVVLGHGTYVNRGFVTVVQHAFVVEQVAAVVHALQPEHTPEELAGCGRL